MRRAELPSEVRRIATVRSRLQSSYRRGLRQSDAKCTADLFIGPQCGDLLEVAISARLPCPPSALSENDGGAALPAVVPGAVRKQRRTAEREA